MKKSGLADSPLFEPPPSPVHDGGENPSTDTIESSKHDIKKPAHHDTAVSRVDETIIEIIRKAVKKFGKEAATHRFTTGEKKLLADIVYTYRNVGIKTSENEITRIAVNFIIRDYQDKGKDSILDQVLRALND